MSLIVDESSNATYPTHQCLCPCLSQWPCPLDPLSYLLLRRTDHLVRSLHAQIHPGNPPASFHHPCPACRRRPRLRLRPCPHLDLRPRRLPHPHLCLRPRCIRPRPRLQPHARPLPSVQLAHPPPWSGDPRLPQLVHCLKRAFWFKLHAKLGSNSTWVQQSAISLGTCRSCPSTEGGPILS